MGYPLLIAEKSSQAKLISQALPHKVTKEYIEVMPCDLMKNGGIITHAIGHLVELVPASGYDPKYKEWNISHLPIIPDKFKLQVIKEKAKQFNLLKKLIHDNRVTEIIHAGDPATEGQLLIDELLILMENKKPVKRLVTTSLTKSAIEKALRNLQDNRKYEPLYFAALARQHSDWVIGINASRLMTMLFKEKGFTSKGGFSAGRVQSVLVSIIYKREKEIESFVSKPYSDLHATYNINNHTYVGKWFKEGAEHIFSKEDAQVLADFSLHKKAEVYSTKKEKWGIRPPQFFNLNTLQTEVNKREGLSPGKVLEVAQSLYEKGLISYPRAEPQHVTPEEAKQFPIILENLRKVSEYAPIIPLEIPDLSNDKRYVDESKTDDHYAIILTEQPVQLGTLSNHEFVIYDLIAKSMIAAHYPNAIENVTEIITVVHDNFSFSSRGKQVLDEGWRVLFKQDKGDGIKPEEEEIIPDVQENEIGTVILTELKGGMTTPPKRFSQGNLITIMSNAGAYIPSDTKGDFTNKELAIGTVATRAAIINQIISKQYIRIEKNLVYIETKGRMLIEALENIDYLTSPVTTGMMEQFLNEMSSGKRDYKKDYMRFMKRTSDIIQDIITSTIRDSETWVLDDYIEAQQTSETVGDCFLCGEPVLDKGNFYGCTGYNKTNCSFTLSKRYFNKEIKIADIKCLLEKGHTALIKGFPKKNKEGFYDAYLVWDTNEQRVKLSFDLIPPNKKKD
ncbi:DNA topoisomerase [Ferdinandcohnia sp. SAFN-114]|uniref:type IA DNA topoisomerase n=1 Tax=Ferdinandcohnia sp. SAFN-114 TaxID=3387275 RepID=UPI003F8047F4